MTNAGSGLALLYLRHRDILMMSLCHLSCMLTEHAMQCSAMPCHAIRCKLACHCATHWLRHSGHHGSIIAFFSGNNIHLQLTQDNIEAAAHTMQRSCCTHCEAAAHKCATQDVSLHVPSYMMQVWAVHTANKSS